MSEVLNLRSRKELEQESFYDDYSREPKKPKRKKILITAIIIVLAVVLSTLGIRASDTLFSSISVEASICPSDMSYIPTAQGGFCMDKYEASASESCSFTDPQNQQETRINLETLNCQPVSQAGNIPWRNISQDQARVACAKAGKRLATPEEWLQSSLGTPDKNSNWDKDDCQVDSNWGKQPGPSGSAKNCVSGHGVFDMIGNVWEWTDGSAVDGKYAGIELPNDGYVKGYSGQAVPIASDANEVDPNYNEDYFWIKKVGERGIARGGYWNNQNEAGVYSAYLAAPPSFVGMGIGFRCVE